MTTFNIFSCCVSRDIFNFHPQDGNWTLNTKNDQYKVLQYINFSSLITHDYAGKNFNIDIKHKIEDEYKKINSKYSKYRFKCSCIDVTSSAVEYLSQQKSDYLILDNGFARFSYLLLSNNRLITNFNRNFISFLADNKYISPPSKFLQFSDISKTDIEKRVYEFCKLILNIYNPKQIILIEVKPALFYIDNNNIYTYNYTYDVSFNYIQRYKYCFELLKKYIKKCLVIKAPNILFGNKNHVWGEYYLHYINEVYDIYYFKQLDYFIKYGTLPNKIVNDIYNQYYTSIASKYFDIFYDSLVKRKYLLKRYNYLLTAHNTALFLNIDYFYILNLKINNSYNNNKLINVHILDQKIYLFITIDNNFYYIKNIDINGNVELCNEMSSIDIIINIDGSISILSNNMFLSARNDSSCIYVDRNKDWEHFKII